MNFACIVIVRLTAFFLKNEKESEQVFEGCSFWSFMAMNLIGNFTLLIDFIFSVNGIDIRCNSAIPELV